MALCGWLRGGPRASPESGAQRLKLLLDALARRPELEERARHFWRVLGETVDASALPAEFGLPSRMAFRSELNERLRQKLLPATPETFDAAELFALCLPRADAAAWLAAVDAATLGRLARLLAAPSPRPGLGLWAAAVLEAIDQCASQVRALGLSAEVRQRTSPEARRTQAFHLIAQDVDAFRAAFLETPREPAQVAAAAARLRDRLEACRLAAASVYPHLSEHGISVGLVFLLRQLRERLLRVRELMDLLLSDQPAAATARLVQRLAAQGEERRSLAGLVAANSSLLAARMTERSAETGETYITRDAAEYRRMLAKAAGGGMVTAGTVVLKFLLGRLALGAFWAGAWAGVLYSASFVLIHLMHWTLATKQPAMTAPAMAARLRDLEGAARIEEFVDEVGNLVRSQVAAVLGNVGLVLPCVLALCLAWQAVAGAPPVSLDQARYVLEALDLRSPTTLLFAAFTGVLLFASSLVAGWAENWFVLHRLDSALRYNPRITRALGRARAARWAQWWREHISGLAASVSLGFMLGLVPPVLGFVGLPLEARHVTLSAGQLAAAAAAFGPERWPLADLAWCAAAIPFIGLLNLAVSFFLAFHLALRAHSVSGVDRGRIRRAIWSRLARRPGSFLLPPSSKTSP